MGFWVLFHAVAVMVNLVALLSSSSAPGAGMQGESSLLIASGFALVGYASFAAGLLLFAPGIASWFSTESASSAPAVTDGPGTVRDVYIIAARLLGLYALLSAVPAAQRLARSILDYRFHSGPAGEFTWASLVEASIYVVGGALLIFLAAGIADVFSRAHGISERPMAGGSRASNRMNRDPHSTYEVSHRGFPWLPPEVPGTPCLIIDCRFRGSGDTMPNY